MKSFVRKAPVMAECEGRKFVSVEDFVACYLEADKVSKKELIEEWHGKCMVEKIDYDILFLMMKNICWGKVHANYAPVVLKDGWVIWVNGDHLFVISRLSRLLFGDVPGVGDAAMLGRGSGWYVSTVKPNLIRCGLEYQPTLGEKIIFSTFKRDDIC